MSDNYQAVWDRLRYLLDISNMPLSCVQQITHVSYNVLCKRGKVTQQDFVLRLRTLISVIEKGLEQGVFDHGPITPEELQDLYEKELNSF